jgi:2-polyprenyl-6-hydroxyphenyl methylase/3-demethylubiquinone-9 3-methyltransferase
MMTLSPAWLAIPIGLQALAMIVDEGVFHRRRGLPKWERIGHPLDTLTIALCLAWLVATRPSDAHALAIYVALAAFSTLFVTKDEPIHTRLCTAGEQWLHSLLFVLHPIVLAAFGMLWWAGGHEAILVGQLAVVVAFGGYQVTYWNVIRRERPVQEAREIDNQWYGPLGPRWYEADDTPIALLRAEARHRNPWIAETIGASPVRVLDLGCGAGFLSNALAAAGHAVTGLDASDESLAVARTYDRSRTATYVRGDACALPFADGSFDVVCAMDLLEHVDDPRCVIAEASRVLAPGGMFFFHTFNRTLRANLIVIKGVEWFVANTPRDLHVLRLFVKPHELDAMCRVHGLDVAELKGSRPRFRWPLWRMLATGRVGDDFAFTFTKSLGLGYTGYARKRASHHATTCHWSAGSQQLSLPR